VHAYRHERAEAVRRLDLAIGYARTAGDPWLEGSALQGRGRAQAGTSEAFADWEQAITRYVRAGDLLNANNVRYMLAGRAVAARDRLADVPVWLDACESYAASHGYRHERAHIQLVRASYLRICGQPAQARELLGAVLPVFRHAGDFRCIARALLELAEPDITGDPPAAVDLLLQSLPAAAIAGDPDMSRRVLTGLTGAAAAAGDLVLAARCRGALGGAPPQGDYATFASEGATGGIALITALYPR
jgi:hypothetical protein